MKTKEEEKETVTDEVSTAELLSKITYQVSFDDLENKLGIARYSRGSRET